MAMDKLYVIVLRISKTMSKVILTLTILLLIYIYFLTLHGSEVESDTETLLPDLPVAARRSRVVVDWDEVQSTDERTEEDTPSPNYLLSLDPDIVKRGKWQRRQINDYCLKHGLERYISDDLHEYQHLLYDDSKKIIFCYVPKVGCSKWKYTFLLLNGIISFTTKRLPESVLKKTKRLSDLTVIERKKRLVEYFKYVFVRNPLERIVSAYRNKVAKTVNTSLIGEKFEEGYKARILKAFKPTEYNAWLKGGKKGPMYPTFSEFIQYLTMENLKKVNEHFQPAIYLCHPCAINYNFYGNFKLLPRDAETLLDNFHLNSSYYDQQSYISHKKYNTSDLVPNYFSELTSQQKEALYYAFADEIDFYYSLYPEEKDNHLSL